MHLVDGIINNLQPLWLRYFHTHSPPYTLIIILLNNQSNIIQYNFHTLSITMTSSYLVLNCKGNFFTKFPLFCFHHKHTAPPSSSKPTRIAQHSILTWLVTVSPCTKKRLSCHLFHAKRTHWAKPATSNAVVAAYGATVLVSRLPFKFHRRDEELLTWKTHNICTQPMKCFEVDGGLSEHLLQTVINLSFMCNKFVI